MLHIYHSSSPLGPWNDTPNNCYRSWDSVTSTSKNVCAGGPNVTTPHDSWNAYRNHPSRPGGRAFVYKGKLYRMVQSATKYYGDGIDMKLVTNLTTTDKIVEEIVLDFRGFFLKGKNSEAWSSLRHHHLDLHRIVQSDGSSLWVGIMVRFFF